MKEDAVQIGVLSIQGSFNEHITALQKLDNVIAKEIRSAQDLTQDIKGSMMKFVEFHS